MSVSPTPEPERTVEWQATGPDGATASGRVEISPSGWGTKVTFSATQALPSAPPSEPSAPRAGGEPLAQGGRAHRHPFGCRRPLRPRR